MTGKTLARALRRSGAEVLVIALLVPLLAAAAPHHVFEDPEIGTWAQVPLEIGRAHV